MLDIDKMVKDLVERVILLSIHEHSLNIIIMYIVIAEKHIRHTLIFKILLLCCKSKYFRKTSAFMYVLTILFAIFASNYKFLPSY